MHIFTFLPQKFPIGLEYAFSACCIVLEHAKRKQVCMFNRLEILIRAIDTWQDAPIQLRACLPDNWSDEIRQWRDSWGECSVLFFYYFA